jgi:hypothetical protein
MKSKHYNYRKYYEKQTNKKIKKDFVIHHLDGNRWDSNINNLVMIEAFIHRNYHKFLLHIYNNELPVYIGDHELKTYNEIKKTLNKAIKERDRLINTRRKHEQSKMDKNNN